MSKNCSELKRIRLFLLALKGDLLMMIDTLLDMTFGMVLGMVASPIMMSNQDPQAEKKVDKILREISEDQTAS